MTPYSKLGDSAFWKKAVASKAMFDIEGLWNPRFRITPKDKVVTFGSCFAQHIGRALAKRGYNWHKTELPPVGLNEEGRARYNYDVFSCRTGNIYTTSLLRQWSEWALGNSVAPEEVWRSGDRFFDPFRPRIEPEGFSSPEEVEFLRQTTLSAFRQCIEEADYFVFTLGLTESWFNKVGYEYPMCPGTVAGEFSADQHRFMNQQFGEVQSNLAKAIEMMRGVNPDLRFILTVSPVPLTATNSGNHVLVATMHSKSILRAVAGQLASNRPYIDYFPSYEIINSPVFRGGFFEPNQRSVNPYGVNFVMDQFFRCQEKKFGATNVKLRSGSTKEEVAEPTDKHCEEALLEAFVND
ncbi:MAG: GSCFA domain-containing protein [Pseudomonadota bacterium]